jgi:hypothetical protein
LVSILHEHPRVITYEAISSMLNVVKLTLEFRNCKNIIVMPSNETDDPHKMVVELRPDARCYLGFVIMEDHQLSSAFQTRVQWELLNPHPDDLKKYMRRSEMKLEYNMGRIRKMCWPHLDMDPDGDSCRRHCRVNNLKWVDLSFPPNNDSLFSLKGHSSDNPFPDNMCCEWKRPETFLLSSVPCQILPVEQPAASDIQQGTLGNAWFASALAALAEQPHFLEDLFVNSKEIDAAGVYILRFFKNGLERFVRIDDLIPCFPGGKGGPLYSRCVGNNLWVMLVEKAYAKLHGSYAAIESGFTHEAMMDLTGAPCEVYAFQDPLVIGQVRKSFFCLFDIIALTYF